MKTITLKKNDKIAIIAPSSGKAVEFPLIYNAGILNLKKIFGFDVIEFPTTKMNSKTLHQNPELRAKDINQAFADKSIKAIITAIGGDDSIRILPFLNKNIIKQNSKIFMGYSDATVLLTYLNSLDVITYHGPSVMAGLAQITYLPKEYLQHLRHIFSKGYYNLEYKEYKQYCNGYTEWSDKNSPNKINQLEKTTGWNWINGKGIVNGELWGGCIEALEFMKSTSYWPNNDFWYKKILFFETSEEKPSINQIKYFLRNYGVQGIFSKISALLFGRSIYFNNEEKQELEKVIKSVVLSEFNCKNLPIITNMDFGHTDPQLIIPIGAKAQIDINNKKIFLTTN